jgi:hypothetical protein
VTAEDEQRVRGLQYNPRKVSSTVTKHHDAFKKAADPKFHCVSNVERKEHPTLPLTLSAYHDPITNRKTGQIVRILYRPRQDDRTLVSPKDLFQLYKTLLFYIDELHGMILKRCISNTLHAERLKNDFFQWIHQQVYGVGPQTLPLIGIIKNPGWEWKDICHLHQYTETQQALTGFFSGAGTLQAAAETAIRVVANYLADHKSK